MHKRPASLFALSLAVGFIGAVAGRLFTWVMIPRSGGFDFGLPQYAYAWVSPLVVFASGAMAFALTFGVLPWTRGRARRAGWVSGVAAYICHALWIALWVGFAFDQSVFRAFTAPIIMFVVIGWLPILSGIFAGWCVERWQRLPREGVEVRRRASGAVAVKFGLVAALVSVPLIYPVFAMARRSRVDFAIFFPSLPFVVFGLATLAFWLVYSMLPTMIARGRTAGVLAALATFLGILFWIRFAINIAARNDVPWDSPGKPFFQVLMLVGWIPLVFGGLAGGWATRRQESPA